MSTTLIVHIISEEPVMGEVDTMPDPSDQFVVITNPRRRDGKEIHYLDEEVNTMIVPWHRISLVQVLPGADVDEVIGFVRE